MDTATPSPIIIIGAGAAGLMAAITAKRQHPERRVVLLDGAKTLGAKILVAGGGRCNVTHFEVTADAYAGSTRPAIAKVLRRFDVPETVAFFREIGVELKREATGKLFPTSDSARTVLNALLKAAGKAKVELKHPYRVEGVRQVNGLFEVSGPWGAMAAQKVVLATGGKSLPKSGSDGHGYSFAKALGHSLTPQILPALVPLTLPREHFICGLSGVATPATLRVVNGQGKSLAAFTNATLLTHFGLSGPAVLDVSRYYLQALADDPKTQLQINWRPELTPEQFEAQLLQAGRARVVRLLDEHLPKRLAQALCAAAEVDPATQAAKLNRQQRKALVQVITALPLPITGDRGFTYAEVTAGGVPLRELHLETMESRVCAGLYLCGEICDVDGQIGGFNFQWAWASGYVVGVSL